MYLKKTIPQIPQIKKKSKIFKKKFPYKNRKKKPIL